MADLISMLAAASGIGAEEADPNFNQTVLLLHGDGTNGAQNNTFLDSSSNNFTITRNGNTTQGTFSPFSGLDGYWSNFFDGTNDRLTIADNAALRPGTGNFTIEAWVYRAAAGAAHTIFAKGASTPTGFAFLITSSDTLRFTDTSTDITSTGTVAANTWVHVAVVREGTGANQLKLYINGVQDGQGTVSTDFNQTEEARIGENRGATDDFNGYISNFRYVVGSAIYTAGFTPSTVPLTTTSQGAVSSEVELLTCQSNRFVDNSTNGFTVTRVNDVRVTPFSPFAPTAAYSAGTNGGSGYFDGTGDSLSVASNANLPEGNEAYTVEAWVKINSNANISLCTWGEQTTNKYFGFSFNSPSAGAILHFWWFNDLTVTGTNVNDGAWHHVAFTYDGTTRSTYLDGVRVGTDTPGTHNVTVTNNLSVGSGWNGNISGLRILTSAIYSGTSFTVPTAPPTAISNTQFLLNFTNAGIIDNTGKNNLETVGNAQIDTTTKKYGTGSLEFDGTGDYLIGPNNSELDFGSGDFTLEFWINFNSLSGAIGVIGKRAAEANFAPFLLEVSSSQLKLYISTSGSAWAVNGLSTSTLSTGTWYHVAAVRSGTTVYLFLNGTSVGSTGTASGSLMTNTTSVTIGRGAVTISVSVGLNGYIDDLRITKGVARYTANFVPPTAAFPNE